MSNFVDILNQNQKLEMIKMLASSYIGEEMDMVLDDQMEEANERAWDTLQKAITGVAEEL